MLQLEVSATDTLPGNRERVLKRLAESIFYELRKNGFTPVQIVGLPSELIGLVTTEISPAGTSDRTDRATRG